MNLLEKLNDALQYIEEHLDKEMDYEKLADLSGYSLPYFQRVFSLLSNITLAEYIRRRRMSVAALELKKSDCRILDLALKYGYESADAFTRAFVQMHGITPSQARKEGERLVSYPPMTFHISIQGEAPLTYRIEKKEEMRILGIRKRFSEPEDSPQSVDVFWNQIFKDGSYHKLLERSDGEPKGVHGFMQQIEEHTMEYTIGVVSERKAEEEFLEYHVPASVWAVFEVDGPVHKKMGSAWKRIFSEWLPESGYNHAQTMEIECFPNTGYRQAEDFYFEIWIPVK